MAAIKCPKCGSMDLTFEYVTCQAEVGAQRESGELEGAVAAPPTDSVLFAVRAVRCHDCGTELPALRQQFAEAAEQEWQDTCDEVFTEGMVLLPRVEKALREATRS